MRGGSQSRLWPYPESLRGTENIMKPSNVLATPVGEECVLTVGLLTDSIQERESVQSVVIEIPAGLDYLSTQSLLDIRMKRELVQCTTDHSRGTFCTGIYERTETR